MWWLKSKTFWTAVLSTVGLAGAVVGGQMTLEQTLPAAIILWQQFFVRSGVESTKA